MNENTKGKILIADDDPKNLKLFSDVLEAVGCEVHGASDGAKAVETAKSIRPDLILMDIQMQVMNGFAATAASKAAEETRGIPVVALTALAMAEDAKRVKAAGCDGYITKPIQINQFLNEVRSYLDAPKISG